MTKVFYHILHLPLEEDGFYPDSSHELYFRPWVDITVEIDGKRSNAQIPHFLLSPDDEEIFFYSYYC